MAAEYQGQAYGGYSAGSELSKKCWDEHQARQLIIGTNEYILANYRMLRPWNLL
jgi:hypothetical protein